MKKIFVISIDALVREDIPYLETKPNFSRIMAARAEVTRVRTVYPALTYPAHCSIMTGCLPGIHGVIHNSGLKTVDDGFTHFYFHTKTVRGEDLFAAAKRVGLSTAAVFWPITAFNPNIDHNINEYFCFYPGIATDYHFSKMAECGMNMLTIEAYDNWEEQLELSEKYGLKGVLFVNGAAGDYYFNQADTKLSEIIAVAKDMPALAGYQIFDEPSVKNIGQIKFEKDRIEELDPNPNHPVYVNLHPSSVSAGGMGVEDYFEYVEKIVTECDLKFITFDQYPVFTSGIDPSWSRSLAAIYESSKRHNIPFWAFTLCCREHNREDPNVGNIRLQCNTNLAYGAQVYRATSGTNYAPLMGDGTYTKAYDDCKTYCTEMHNRGYVFSGSDVKFLRQTIEADTYGCFLSERDYPDAVSAFSTSGPTLVSFIENKGNSYMVVVNKNWQEAINVDITFEDMVYVIDHDGEFTEYQKGDAHLSIEEGDMMVIKYR